MEAKDHIGGRAYTQHEEWEGKDIPIDLGAMWIQNAANNLLNDYANKFCKEVKSHPSTFDTQVYRENNQGPMPEDEYERYSESLYEGFYAVQENRQDKAWQRGDESLQISANKFLESLKDDPSKQKMTKLLLRDNIEMEYSGSLHEFSLKYWNADSWIGGEKSDDFFVLSGYSSLLHAYAKDEGLLEQVILNAPVSSINYESPSGAVQVCYRDSTTARSSHVSVWAKKVIVTVPLGVLQARSMKFIPDLPTSTSNAIDRLGMGRMNKIFMFWKAEDIFWPLPSKEEVEVFGDLTDRDSNFVFYNSLSFQEDKPALFAFFKGPLVEQIEQEDSENPSRYEQRITDLAMESLRSMFGEATPRPERVVVTKWNVDKYTMGAYSFNKVGMKKHDREVLASPIGSGKRIFFAGEATHTKYFATTTGAFLTGRTAAKQVVKTLKKFKIK